MSAFKLNFDGKVSILFGLKDSGPMEFKANDMDLVVKIARIMIDSLDGNSTTVDSYDDEQAEVFKKIMDSVE